MSIRSPFVRGALVALTALLAGCPQAIHGAGGGSGADGGTTDAGSTDPKPPPDHAFPGVTPVELDAATDTVVVVSPDEKHVVVSRPGPKTCDASELWLVSLDAQDEPTVRQLSARAGDVSVQFSTDGAQVAWLDVGVAPGCATTLMTAPVAGGDAVAIAEDVSDIFVAGPNLFFVQGAGDLRYEVVPFAGGTPLPIAAAPTYCIAECSDDALWPSPDGRSYAFVGGLGALWLQSPAGHTKLFDGATDTMPPGAFPTPPVWSPDSKHLVFFHTRDGGETMLVSVVDTTGDAPSTIDAACAGGACVAFSPDGARLAWETVDGSAAGVKVRTFAGGPDVALPSTAPADASMTLAFSPSGGLVTAHWTESTSDAYRSGLELATLSGTPAMTELVHEPVEAFDVAFDESESFVAVDEAPGDLVDRIVVRPVAGGDEVTAYEGDIGEVGLVGYESDGLHRLAITTPDGPLLAGTDGRGPSTRLAGSVGDAVGLGWMGRTFVYATGVALADNSNPVPTVLAAGTDDGAKTGVLASGIGRYTVAAIARPTAVFYVAGAPGASSGSLWMVRVPEP